MNVIEGRTKRLRSDELQIVANLNYDSHQIEEWTYDGLKSVNDKAAFVLSWIENSFRSN